MAELALSNIVEALQATVATKQPLLDRTVSSGCASDLMSDVLAFSEPKSILLTGLLSPQAVRSAEVADIQAVCFVFGKKPTHEMVVLAENAGITLMVTSYSLFTASGIVYELGLCGCSETV